MSSARDADVRFEGLLSFPERPESEFEWEDLLLRLELMPRALKVELEGRRGADVAEVLGALNHREMAVQQLLEEVAMAGPAAHAPERPNERPGEPSMAASNEPSLEARLDRFVRLRGRNFAMLQRRGIDVWNWRIRIPPDDTATVFQLLSLLGRNDVEALSRLRTARKSMPGPC